MVRGGAVGRADHSAAALADTRAPFRCAPIMTYLIPILMMVAGNAILVQVAANSRQREIMQSPVVEVFFAFVIGASLLGVIAIRYLFGRGRWSPSSPWCVWIGG